MLLISVVVINKLSFGQAKKYFVFFIVILLILIHPIPHGHHIGDEE